MPAWTEQPIHFIDFEGNRRSGILEYGIATVRDGRVESASTRLCAPLGRVMADETAVHGLAEGDLAGAAPFSDEWPAFCALRASGPLAAHFAGVENGLIKSVWPYPPTSPDFARPGASLVDWGPWVDTASLYAELYPNFPSLALGELVASMGLQAELDELGARHCPERRRRYHAALYDALAGALLLAVLARTPAAGLGLAELLALSTRSGERRDELRQGTLF
ncbi:hypothetical protein GALL_115070 [mine drainage metagenome]|uniref:DNA polymerase III subunit epsilon n=1 Tax=mine drainage metagenome TaxID=410659 RepID=A0A1J5SQI8_9ZZZZ